MKRLTVLLGTALAMLAISAPAYAYAHDRVTNPVLHTLLDLLTVAAVTAPLWTVAFWGRDRRALMLGLIAVVQIPVAVIAFSPIANPVVHAVALVTALVLTGFSFWYARRPSAVATSAISSQ